MSNALLNKAAVAGCFKPVIVQKRATLCECCGFNARAAGGRLSRCLSWLQFHVGAGAVGLIAEAPVPSTRASSDAGWGHLERRAVVKQWTFSRETFVDRCSPSRPHDHPRTRFLLLRHGMLAGSDDCGRI